jgi:hypothetical protein
MKSGVDLVCDEAEPRWLFGILRSGVAISYSFLPYYHMSGRPFAPRLGSRYVRVGVTKWGFGAISGSFSAGPSGCTFV